MGVIDHINGNKSDNTLANLRCVTESENCQNAVLKLTDKYGNPVGAHYHKPSKSFKSSIMLMGKQVHLGYFPTAAEASAAYLAAKRKHHIEQEFRHA